MPLFKVKDGDIYERDEVVQLCLNYIHSPEFSGNVTEKEQKIGKIQSKRTKYLEFRSRGKGWGSSPMNPNCWIEVTHNPENYTKKLLETNSSRTNVGLQNHNRIIVEGDKYNAMASPASSHLKADNKNSEAQFNRRPWQATYRNELFRIWKGACAVTGCTVRDVLTASHLKPVIYCSEEEARDPYNGILLTSNCDKLLDKGLMTFDDDGTLIISRSIPKRELEVLGIHGAVNGAVKVRFNEHHLPYLRFHREKIFKN